MKKRYLLLLAILCSCSSSSNIKMLQTVGFTLGLEEDKYSKCHYDENGNIIIDNELTSTFMCSSIIYSYFYEKEYDTFKNKTKQVKDLALNLSCAFDDSSLYLKDDKLMRNLAYLNLNQDENTFVEVDKYTYDLFKISYDLTLSSKGKFNFAILNLSSIWDDYIHNGATLPSEDLIKEELSYIPSYNVLSSLISFDDNSNGIKIKKYKDKKINFTFNGIAKGRFLDLINDIYLNTSTIVNAGSSSISTYGDSFYENWKLNIRNPNYIDDKVSNNTYLNFFMQGAFSLSISGDYQNYRMEDNVRYHHIIDTKTGYPATYHRSTVILGNNATYLDALSTALMLCDESEAKELINEMNQLYNLNAHYILIDEIDKKIIYKVETDLKNNVSISSSKVSISYL